MKSFTLIEILIVVGILALLAGLSITVLSLFQMDLNPPQQATSSSSDENRIKDSRHVHFDYSRVISTAAERLILTFDYDSSPIIQEIIITDNLQDGQIFWEGQNIKIQTHRLNNPDTQFSVHRDRRYNTKNLKIEISGDSSGDLIRYQADGQTIKGNSIYVADPNLQ